MESWFESRLPSQPFFLSQCNLRSPLPLKISRPSRCRGQVLSSGIGDKRRRDMPEMDDEKKDEHYHADIPQKTEQFFLKGSDSLDWGMKNRLSRIFNPASGRTVMLAVDHGYFQGPTSGLGRMDISILPLIPYADA